VASSPAKDTVSHGAGTETDGSDAAVTTAAMTTVSTTTVAMTTKSLAMADTVAAAALFDAAEDSDSSASSDILQICEVCPAYFIYVLIDR